MTKYPLILHQNSRFILSKVCSIKQTADFFISPPRTRQIDFGRAPRPPQGWDLSHDLLSLASAQITPYKTQAEIARRTRSVAHRLPTHPTGDLYGRFAPAPSLLNVATVNQLKDVGDNRRKKTFRHAVATHVFFGWLPPPCMCPCYNLSMTSKQVVSG